MNVLNGSGNSISWKQYESLVKVLNKNSGHTENSMISVKNLKKLKKAELEYFHETEGPQFTTSEGGLVAVYFTDANEDPRNVRMIFGGRIFICILHFCFSLLPTI